MKRAVMIVNPISRPLLVKRCVPRIGQMLEREGYDVEIVVSRKAGDPAQYAAEAVGNTDAVLIAGGDGTISEVLNATVGQDLLLGLIPLGTTNVFARELGLPLDPLAATLAFLTGRPLSYDLGRLGDLGFLIMASYGYDGFTVRHTSLRMKRVFGRFAYVLTGLLGLPFYRPEPIEIFASEGEEPISATFAVFSNASRYAGDFITAPDADLHDGFLDVFCWTQPGWAGAVCGLINVFRGRLSRGPWLKAFRARDIQYRTRRPHWFQVDGDPAEGRSGTISVEHDAFRMVTPAQ